MDTITKAIIINVIAIIAHIANTIKSILSSMIDGINANKNNSIHANILSASLTDLPLSSSICKSVFLCDNQEL